MLARDRKVRAEWALYFLASHVLFAFRSQEFAVLLVRRILIPIAAVGHASARSTKNSNSEKLCNDTPALITQST